MGSLQHPASGAPRATLCHPVPPRATLCHLLPQGSTPTRSRSWAQPAAEQL